MLIGIFCVSFKDEDILIESEEEIIHDSGDHEHVQHLRAKKEELEKRVKEKTRQQENIKVHFHLLCFDYQQCDYMYQDGQLPIYRNVPDNAIKYQPYLIETWHSLLVRNIILFYT